MKKVLVSLAVLVLSAGTATAQQKVKLGEATGGMMVYYNNVDVSGEGGVPDGRISGYDETPDNQAYMKLQFGYSDTDGMGFQFDDTPLYDPVNAIWFNWNDIFSGQPVGSSQFGLDAQATALTYNPAGGVTVPTMDFADNVDNTVPNALLTNAIHTQGEVAWAINDYKGGTASGPGQGGGIINSLMRGLSFTMVVDDLRMVGTTYELDIHGELTTDGKFHWYDPNEPGQNGDGTTDLAAWGLMDALYYEGTLVYDIYYAGKPWGTVDNTYENGFENGIDQMDFYEGTINVYSQIPEPTSVVLAAQGLLFLLLLRWYVRRPRATRV